MSVQPKKFGYMYPAQAPAPLEPQPTPTDEIAYITAYMDVRARQIYDKLKALFEKKSSGSSSSTDDDNEAKDYVLLKDQNDSDKIYKVYVKDGSLCSEEYTD